MGVIVGDHHAFLGDAVDVGRGDGAQAAVVGGDVHGRHVVDHDDDNIGFLCGLRYAQHRKAQPETQDQVSYEKHEDVLYGGE
ncbi:hypothetical protein D3C80_2110050 [compost metagenome]